ncbi:hypothetical protein BH24PSE1_BH24PSE1_10050 [soil metagenome]
MSGQQTITRTLVAAIGAILMSTVVVGSAVVPAHNATPAQSSINV